MLVKCGITLCIFVTFGFVDRLCAYMLACLGARPRVLRKQPPLGHGCVHLPSPDPTPAELYWVVVVVVEQRLSRCFLLVLNGLFCPML